MTLADELAHVVAAALGKVQERPVEDILAAIAAGDKGTINAFRVMAGFGMRSRVLRYGGTRSRVLRYITEHGPVTTRGICLALGMRVAHVGDWIGRLRADNAIEAVGEEDTSRGRKAPLYAAVKRCE